jgi:hypothetical protein
VGKPEGKTPLGKPGHRWEDNIKVGIREIGWGGWVDSSSSGQAPVADSGEHDNEPSGAIKCWEIVE